ncbi:uncharacterized protein B0H18DRAFT_893745 [Fomitopsis serialis]|uniref:uncharacterized protein n=1 Tax=Fomitopsis serialis TaxID=139415 RepID=UPI002007E396|nr:uncharacterized protein B0H18DRAFT_893745 [Neoantrodia serialis]KAH9911012.1 hypothetical protein B0H18DRAFT_893745 [Neoantrodia serialis]
MGKRAEKSVRAQAFTSIVASIVGDEHALALIPRTCDPRPRGEFTALLEQLASRLPSPTYLPKDLFSGFCTWANDPNRDLPGALRTAIQARNRAVQCRRTTIRLFVQALGGIKPLDEPLKAYWLNKNANSVRVKALEASEVYPEFDTWVAESLQIRVCWTRAIEEGKQADRRHKRHPIEREEAERLAYEVRENENVVFRDIDSGEIIMIVLRNFCRDALVVEGVNATMELALAMRKSVRLEDPGKIVNLGYTAGARNHPLFDWTKNLKSKKHDPDDLKDINFEISSVFALFWALLRVHLPQEVLRGFEDYLADNDMCRMDADEKRGNVEGEYVVHESSLEAPSSRHRLALLDATTPGMFDCSSGLQFLTARCRAIHNEKQPQKWAFSWTTKRDPQMKRGGQFYLAKYGIKVRQAANTMVAWQPEHAHGTSLLPGGLPRRELRESSEAPILQAGLAFVTSTRLASTWKSYLKHKDAERAKAEYMQSAEDDVAAANTERDMLAEQLESLKELNDLPPLTGDYPCSDDVCAVCS